MTGPILIPTRSRAGIGRGKSSGGTLQYCLPGCVIIGTSTFVLTASNDYYAPFFLETPIEVDQIGFNLTVGAASSNIRMGLYACDEYWQPIGPPLADSGNLDASTTGTKTYAPSVPIFLPPGRYLTVLNASASVTVRHYRGLVPGSPTSHGNLSSGELIAGFIGRSYAAFPTPGTRWDSEVLSATPGWRHPILLRIVGL